MPNGSKHDVNINKVVVLFSLFNVCMKRRGSHREKEHSMLDCGTIKLLHDIYFAEL